MYMPFRSGGSGGKLDAKDWFSIIKVTVWIKPCLPMHSPLFPRMKQSPYLAFSWPFTYSSVCSMAIFRYPSKHAKTPRYSVPEFKRTLTDLPSTALRKSEGDRFLAAALDTREALDPCVEKNCIRINWGEEKGPRVVWITYRVNYLWRINLFVRRWDSITSLWVVRHWMMIGHDGSIHQCKAGGRKAQSRVLRIEELPFNSLSTPSFNCR
jgi:hypothetical protein